MRRPLIKMIFRKPFWFAMISAFILNGCELASLAGGVAGVAEAGRTLENYQDSLYISHSYSLDRVQSYGLDLSCEKVNFVRIRASLKPYYCNVLDREIKKSMKQMFPEWRVDKNNPDIWIQVIWEAAWGGRRPYKSTIAHLLGNRISYVEPIVFIQITRRGAIIAKHRLKMISSHSMPLFMEKTTNERAFMETAGSLAEGITAFVENPESVKPQEEEDEEVY